MVNETTQKGWQAKNNDGKFGFFPTSLEVVKMEMSLIDFSEITSDLPIHICDFTGGIGEQLYTMHKYLLDKDLTPYSYYNELSEERFGEAKKKYGGIKNFHLLNTNFFSMRCQNVNGKKFRKSNFAIIRNNPPYTFIDDWGKKVRAEDKFFIENTPYNMAGGIHIFELRLAQLIEQERLLKKICFRYENVNILKFPKEEFKKFGQVVVVGQKKIMNSNDLPLANKLRKEIILDKISYLDEVSKPIYKLPLKFLKNIQPINVFRDGRVNDITLSNGLNEVIMDLIKEEKSKDILKNNLIRLDDKPIIERTIGHKTIELNAGKFNGISGNVLIQGGSQKAIIESSEVDENGTEIKTETEILKPYIEITNSAGDIILKDC